LRLCAQRRETQQSTNDPKHPGHMNQASFLPEDLL
jgi:hypothetical protein